LLPVGNKIVKLPDTGRNKRIGGIRLESSYMAEAIVTLPVFVTFMTVLLFFFRILQVQQLVDNALIQTARELSVAAYESTLENLSDNGISAGIILQKNLKGSQPVKQFIRGGNVGISLFRSDFTGDYITLVADYQMQVPVVLLGKYDLAITQQVKCRKWTGNSGTTADSGKTDVIVYITQNGTVYHKNRDCTYLKPKVRSISVSRIKQMRSKDGSKYYACSKCGKSRKGEMVYITDYGNRYHCKRNCSEIQRRIYAVFLSEAGGRKGCSKCSK